MSSDCKGVCDFNSESQRKFGYKNGQKYCPKCTRYFFTELTTCYCCKNKLRTKSREYRKGKLPFLKFDKTVFYNNMTSNGFKSITVRERTYEKIEELARKENRSVSNLIDTLIMTNIIREEKAIQ